MRRALAVLAGLALGVALTLAAPAVSQVASPWVARLFTSTAPSGSNGFACKVNGCRVDLGAAASDYFYSDGTQIRTPGSLVVAGVAYSTQGRFSVDGSQPLRLTGAEPDGASSVAVRFQSFYALSTAGARSAGFYSDAGSTLRAAVAADGTYESTFGYRWTALALPTCTPYYEGTLTKQGGSGGTRTKLCLCSTADGSTYAWQNIASAAVGTASTCP